MMRGLLITICLCLSFLASPQAFSAEYVIWGPQTYTRDTGKPSTTTTTFKSRITGAGAAKLIVLNGDASGNRRVSSARIVLNGKEVASPSDFNQKTDFIEKTISLEYSNTLDLKLASRPDSFLTIKVIGKYPAPVVHITSPAPSDTILAPDTLVRGWVETAADRVQVTVNGERALVLDREFFVNGLPLAEGENTLTVRMEDSYRYAAQTEHTLFSEQQSGITEWIDLQIEEPGGFAPLETSLIIKPKLAHDIAAGSANLQYEGPQGVTTTPVNTNEYRLRFVEPGLYTFKYSVADTQGNIYSRQAIIVVMAPITEADWLTMKGQVQDLEEYFSSAVASRDVQTARLKTLQRALEDSDFSQVVLSSGTLFLVYQGKIPFILDVPDPNAPAID